jgi:hypothetical protein
MNQIIALNNGSGLYETRIYERSEGQDYVLESLYDGEVVVSSNFATLSEATMHLVLNWSAEYDSGQSFTVLSRELKVG